MSRIVEPTGTIKKLSVAVLVDRIYEGGAKAGDAGAEQPKKHVPRSEDEMKRIEDRQESHGLFDGTSGPG